MLVLTRKTQQQIQIGDKITITILRVKGNTVRVGIDAPRDERIIRSELNERQLSGPKTNAPAAAPAIGAKTGLTSEHPAAYDFDCDNHERITGDTASPLANRVRVLTSQAVRYPEPLRASSLRCALGRR